MNDLPKHKNFRLSEHPITIILFLLSQFFFPFSLGHLCSSSQVFLSSYFVGLQFSKETRSAVLPFLVDYHLQTGRKWQLASLCKKKNAKIVKFQNESLFAITTRLLLAGWPPWS